MSAPSGRSHLPLSLSNTGLGVGAGAVWFVAVTVGGGGGNGVSSFFPQEERMPAARMVIRRLFDFIVTLSRSRYRVSVVPGAGGYDLPGGYPWSVKTTACRVVSSSAAGVLALLIVSCWAGAGAHRARKPTDPGRVAGSSRSPSR